MLRNSDTGNMEVCDTLPQLLQNVDDGVNHIIKSFSKYGFTKYNKLYYDCNDYWNMLIITFSNGIERCKCTLELNYSLYYERHLNKRILIPHITLTLYGFINNTWQNYSAYRIINKIENFDMCVSSLTYITIQANQKIKTALQLDSDITNVVPILPECNFITKYGNFYIDDIKFYIHNNSKFFYTRSCNKKYLKSLIKKLLK